jgi:hypothetical protein
VTGDEPNHSGGDGNTTNDIVIASDCKLVHYDLVGWAMATAGLVHRVQSD